MRWPATAISIIYEGMGGSAALDAVNRQMEGVALMRAILPLAAGVAPVIFTPAMAQEGHDRFRRTWDDYVDGAVEEDPTLIALAGAVATGAGKGTLLSTGFDAFAPDYMRWSRGMTGTEWITDWRRDGDRLHVFALHRPISCFDPGEAAALRLLGGHVLLAERMAGEQAIAAADAVAEPVFLIDGRMMLHHANPAADRLLAFDDGLRLLGGRIECDDRATDAVLRRATMTAVAGGSPEPVMLLVPARRTDRRYLARVSPVRLVKPGGGTARGAQLRIVDTAAPLSAEALDCCVTLFRLTPAERTVAAALTAAGAPLAAIAAACGISYSTARTHVARLQAKTGTASLAELVRLLSRFA